MTLKSFLRPGLLTVFAAAASLGAAAVTTVTTVTTEPQQTRRPNVLFISIDDLRPELGCYGASQVKSPNIDSLAAGGTAFTRAYCQQALCAPSRASLMTGLRPDSSGVVNLVTHIRLKRPDVVTVSQHFKNAGYHAQSFGKIYHPGLDDPDSWSEPAWFPPGPEYGSTETLAKVNRYREEKGADRYIPGSAPAVKKDPKTGLGLEYEHPARILMGPSTESIDVSDEFLEDGQVVEKAVEAMHRLKDKPFFLAVGMIRPHLPFVAPKKYWDLYRREEIEVAPNQFPPKDVARFAMNDVGELNSYWDIPTTRPVPLAKQRELIHGYYASVSYVDALVGRLLGELEAAGLSDNTIVVLWGDHGYQLGEHGLWCKHTNFEVANRVPLIFRAPGQKAPGTRPKALAELVDVYPTLCDLAGLPRPKELEGSSLAPFLDDPNRPGKSAAFSQYPVRGPRQGYSMRTDRYRYTEWLAPESRTLREVELYDHNTDPGENVNLALRPENAELTATLSRQLRAGWREAQPKR